MGRRICLSSPPTSLDAYSQNALELPCWVMPLLSPGFSAPLRSDFRQPNHGLPLPGDTLRCKRSLVVPEYQPDVHRLRRVVLGLGPTNPERTSLPQETLGLRRVGFSPTLRYSCRHSHSRTLQPSLRSTFTAERDAPLPPEVRRTGPQTRSFGTKLEPRWIFGAESLDQ